MQCILLWLMVPVSMEWLLHAHVSPQLCHTGNPRAFKNKHQLQELIEEFMIVDECPRSRKGSATSLIWDPHRFGRMR